MRHCDVRSVTECEAGGDRSLAPVEIFGHTLMKLADPIEDRAWNKHVAGSRETQFLNVTFEIECKNPFKGLNPSGIARV